VGDLDSDNRTGGSARDEVFPGQETSPRGRYLAILSLGALGVVYGDIGTSPLYALRECFYGPYAVPPTHENVLGVLSLVFWSLILVISVKYLAFVMRADNRGEGGILALMSLIRPAHAPAKGGRWLLVIIGIFGAALLYGDGMITPAISVLSAVEGLRIATPLFSHLVEPATIVILIALFLFQKRGTGGVGAVFGPVMLLWFLVLAVLGAVEIAREPAVLAAVNPVEGIRFFARNAGKGFLVLGAVFLVVTGGEALYADMGHFGTRPIRLAWFSAVLPALLLNYFGQGALLLQNPEASHNPFYRLAPSWALYPMVVLATAATVIASQAVISGAFSLTRQAVQLGYSPRVEIDHTSARKIGQIYIPSVNWVLMLATIGLVLGFRSSSRLADAYGVAVTTTMVITTVLLAIVARERWKWKTGLVAPLIAFFLVIDLSFFGANITKIPTGGWFPLAVAAAIFTLLTTWRRGRQILSARLLEDTISVDSFLKDVETRVPHRVPGTAVFMSRTPEGVPAALLHNFKHNKVIHERVVFLTVVTEEKPTTTSDERREVEGLGQGFFRLLIRYGFMEDPDIPEELKTVQAPGLAFPPGDTTFFLGKETILATPRPGMAIWRERLFAAMTRNARSATSFFKLPPNRVVEMGAQIEI
jgi:KUP system potassium uptake protein